MEPYGYRENLESILAYTGGRHMVSLTEAKDYLGFVNPRAVHKRCPYFVGGYTTAETFAKALCDYGKNQKRRR